MCKEFIVIGIPDDKRFAHGEQIGQLLQENRLFSGGKRHHELMKPYLPHGYIWIDITVPLEDVFVQYEKMEGTIVVFASGDPLFFGFANTLQRQMPDVKITVYPYFNSLQMLAHRLLMPYHDMHIVSLTGRPWHAFDEALIRGWRKIGVLTDNVHTPAAIAQRMLDYGYDRYVMSVGEHLGNPDHERITTLSLEEVVEREFARLNCLILQKVHHSSHLTSLISHLSSPFPLPDHLFELLDGREKMITKAPIRLLTLASLELRNRQSFWDIGFCTGSVSIEAKLMFPHLHVTAFEIREEGRRLMDVNSHRFHAPGIETVMGDFLQLDVSGYPQPDAVFIGGHGGHLPEMVQKTVRCLSEGGILVYNCVLPSSVTDARIRTDNRERFIHAAKACGLLLEEPLHVAINDYHPIDILKARKP
jgi:precorrin-6Y C5,15-methyltransferase (decarboxylating)